MRGLRAYRGPCSSRRMLTGSQRLWRAAGLVSPYPKFFQQLSTPIKTTVLILSLGARLATLTFQMRVQNEVDFE